MFSLTGVLLSALAVGRPSQCLREEFDLEVTPSKQT